jgi:hypothetical protein
MAEYTIERPIAPAASGWTLRGMVAVAESRVGPAVINWSNRSKCPGLLQASIAALSGTQCRVARSPSGQRANLQII